MNIRSFDQFKKYVATHDNVKKCILRCDLNLPSHVEDLTRIYAIKETVQEILKLGLKVILISHYKRPEIEDVLSSRFSLANVAEQVSRVLEEYVEFVKDSIFDVDPSIIQARISLLENLRFYEGEVENDEELAKRLSQFGDIYINDAFSVSHRAHASVSKITEFLPSFAGLSLEREIEGIAKVTENIDNPFTAIIGGFKVASKIEVLKTISQRADYLIITGAMANTFLAAQGVDLKNSFVEKDQFETARNILENSKAKIILPVDFLASKDINTNGDNFEIDGIPGGYSCFDIGSKTTENIIDTISKSKTLLWNGALGAFEFANFDRSSKLISQFIASQTREGRLISVIGGGETVASLGEYKKDVTFVSTAGGAFLEMVAGYDLPGIKCLLC